MSKIGKDLLRVIAFNRKECLLCELFRGRDLFRGRSLEHGFLIGYVTGHFDTLLVQEKALTPAQADLMCEKHRHLVIDTVMEYKAVINDTLDKAEVDQIVSHVRTLGREPR